MTSPSTFTRLEHFNIAWLLEKTGGYSISKFWCQDEGYFCGGVRGVNRLGGRHIFGELIWIAVSSFLDYFLF